MINLAGNKDADTYIKEELYLAGIETINVGGKVNSEVPYSIIGRIGHWTLTRAWYYWIAKVEHLEDGLPLDIAINLHETPNPIDKIQILGHSIRSGGHAGSLSPAEYGAHPDYNEEFYKQLKKLGYPQIYSDILKKEYIPINVGEVSKLCNEGKLNVKRYVDCYHIDDQIGLNEFAKVVKTLQTK